MNNERRARDILAEELEKAGMSAIAEHLRSDRPLFSGNLAAVKAMLRIMEEKK